MMGAVRRSPALFVFGAALVLLLSGGCRGCFCTNAGKALAETAPKEVVLDLAKKELDKSPAKLSTICGVNVSALEDMVVTLVKSEWARHQVRVEGKAVRSTTTADAGPLDDEEEDDGDESDAAADGDALLSVDASIRVDAASRARVAASSAPTVAAVAATARRDAAAPIIVDPLKTILCIGVVVLTIDPVLDDHGNRSGWKPTTLEVESVMTAGVVFDKAHSGSGGHHRRHHHH